MTITAISDRNGINPRDEVIIDVRTLSQPPEKPPVEPEEKYYPYMWVGVREISGGSGVHALNQSDKDGSDFLLNFCVFEPGATLPSQTVTTLGAHNYQNDLIEYPNFRSLTDFDDKVFYWSVYGFWRGPQLVWTDRGLVLAAYGVASPLSPGYPDTLWQICAILDPYAGEMEIKETSPFVFGGATYESGVSPVDPIPLQSQVVAGDYVVKLMGGMESCMATYNTTYELKAIVGRAPGCVVSHTTSFTISQGSPYFSDWHPGGYNYAAEADGEYGFGNNRPDPLCWWPGALRIDVLNGVIVEEENYYPQPEAKPDVWFEPDAGLIDVCETPPDCLPSPYGLKQEETFEFENPFYLYDIDPDSPQSPGYLGRPPWYLMLRGAYVLQVEKDRTPWGVAKNRTPCTVQISSKPLGCNPGFIGEGEVWDAGHNVDDGPSEYNVGDYVQVVGFSVIGSALAVSNKLNRSAIEQDPPVYFGNVCPCEGGAYRAWLLTKYPASIVNNWFANNNCP